MNRVALTVWLKRLQIIGNAVIVLYAATLCLPITIPWVLLIAGLVILALTLCLRAALAEPIYEKPPLLYPLLGLAVITIIVGLVHGGVPEALRSFMTLRPLVAYFWAFDLFTRNDRLQATTISVLLASAAIAGFWGTIEQLTGFHPFSFKFLQGTGFLSGPMAFAGQMQLFSMLTIGLAISKGYKSLLFNAPIFAVVAAGNVLGLIFSGERSAWLGFGVALLVVAAFVPWRLTAKISGALLVISALAWNFVPVFKTRLLPLLDWKHDVSTTARLIVWEKAWQAFQENPFFGVGVRSFPHVVIPEALVPGQASYLGHGHSNYLHILATTGLSGFAVYIWLLLASLRLAWQQANLKVDAFRSSEFFSFKRGLGIGLLGGLVSLSVSGIFEYNFGTGQVRLAEWFLLALLIPIPGLAPAEIKDKPESKKRRSDKDDKQKKAA